eukprot:g1791.t1
MPWPEDDADSQAKGRGTRRSTWIKLLIYLLTTVACATLVLATYLQREERQEAAGVVSNADRRAAEGGAARQAAAKERTGDEAWCAPGDDAGDCSALVALARSTGLAGNWTKRAGWLSGASVCGWYGVLCGPGGRVTEVDLGSNHLLGILPRGLSRLEHLRVLNLDNNLLRGWLPPDLQFPQLQRLNVGYNRGLQGTLPDLARATPGLTHLFVNFCAFTGSVAWLGGLRELQSAYLCGNHLRGPVPDLHNCHALEFLDLNNNRFDGDHPSLAGLQALRYVDLSRNELHGTVPDLRGHPQLQYLLLNDNKIAGELPSLGECHELHSVDLKNNRFVGGVPRFSLPKLQYLDLAHNDLSGTLPITAGRVMFDAPGIGYIGLDHNDFEGSLGGASTEHAMERAPDLLGVNIAHNRLTAVHPSVCAAWPKIFAEGTSAAMENG